MKRYGPPPPRTTVVSSSPGRASEKLPPTPGLMRLLRGKSLSRSRGRTSIPRSSPIFASRSTRTETEQEEPSSPKVTCIGQVRIRSKRGKQNKSDDNPKLTISKTLPIRRCRCFERSLLSKIFSKKPSLRRWWSTLSLGSKKKSRYREADVEFPAAVVGSRSSISDLGNGDDEEEEEETRVFMPSSTSTPPKNALLLMRCRSAPHNRSSILATSRFSVSPEAVEAEPKDELGEGRRIVEGEEGSGSGSRINGDGDLGAVVLTRCKSEPARTAAAKLVEGGGLWNSCGSRRLGVVSEGRGTPPPLLLG